MILLRGAHIHCPGILIPGIFFNFVFCESLVIDFFWLAHALVMRGLFCARQIVGEGALLASHSCAGGIGGGCFE